MKGSFDWNWWRCRFDETKRNEKFSLAVVVCLEQEVLVKLY